MLHLELVFLCSQVERIKERVEEKEGIPPPQQRYVISVGTALYIKSSTLLCVCISAHDSLSFSCRLIFSGKQM